MHQGFVARACTASVCGSQQVYVQEQAQHGIASSFLSPYLQMIASSFSLPTLWDAFTQNTRYVCMWHFLSHKFSLIVGIWLYKYHSHVEWNITTSSPLNMGIYCTCCYYHYIHMYVGHIDKTNTPSICFEVNFKFDKFFGFVFPSKFSKQIILLKKGL